jgi:antitoxin YefM
VANAEDIDSLKKELANNLVEYAQEYIDEFHLYVNAPNRKEHFPFVIHVLIQPDIDAVIRLINAQVE